MERRTFLKNIFGAAMIIAMPKIIVDQIENLPPEIIPDRLHEGDEPGHTVYDQCLFIHDGEFLIGASTSFNLTMHRDPIFIGDDDKGYPEYIMGPFSWEVSADRFVWVNEELGHAYFMSNKPLQCLIYHQERRIKGEALLTQLTINAPMEEEIDHNLTMEGTGKLIMEEVKDNENDSAITQQLGAAKREAISGGEKFSGIKSLPN